MNLVRYVRMVAHFISHNMRVVFATHAAYRACELEVNMELVLKKEIFLVKPMKDFLRNKMDATIKDRLGHTTSIDIPDHYASGDNIQMVAAYLLNCGALSNKDAATIVRKSRFSSTAELVKYWRTDVENLIDAEGVE